MKKWISKALDGIERLLRWLLSFLELKRKPEAEVVPLDTQDDEEPLYTAYEAETKKKS